MDTEFYFGELNTDVVDPSSIASYETEYKSPIIEIIQEIRRKNGAAAAAVASDGYLQHHGLAPSTLGKNRANSNSDPWDLASPELDAAGPETSLDEVDDDDDDNNESEWLTYVGRPSRRHGSFSINRFYNNRPRLSSEAATRDAYNTTESRANVGQLEIAKENVTKIPESQQSVYSNKLRSSSEVYYSRVTMESHVGDPRHAEALLQTTPQLRFLSLSSTNTQRSGRSKETSNIFLSLVKPLVELTDKKKLSMDQSNNPSGSGNSLNEYRSSLVRNRANRQSSAELASLLWILAHEMSLEEYGAVETDVFKMVFALVHFDDKDRRMAGLAALDALLSAPSSDEEKKSIKFANTLSNGLRSANGDYEIVSAISQALGHMAMRAANVDFVESEVTRALEWLRTDRSDRRLAACLSLKEFAIHLPTTFHSKTSNSSLGHGGSNEFLDHIFKAIHDHQPIVRACATDALSQCLRILVERRHPSLTGLLCQVHFSVMDGLRGDSVVEPNKKKAAEIEADLQSARHGSLLSVASMVAYTKDFMVPRYEEVCRAVLECKSNQLSLIRLEVIRLLPRLAQRSPSVFGRRYLEEALSFLMECTSIPPSPRGGIDLRPTAFSAVGQLIVNMTDESTGLVIGGTNVPTLKFTEDPSGIGQIVELMPCGFIYQSLEAIFTLIRSGLRPSPGGKAESLTVTPALHCAACVVESLGSLSLPYIEDLIDDMFRSGLSDDLIRCLQLIAEVIPEQHDPIEKRLLEYVSLLLAGDPNMYDPLSSFRDSGQSEYLANGLVPTNRNVDSQYESLQIGSSLAGEVATTDINGVLVNFSPDLASGRTLCLCMHTLASFGGSANKATSFKANVPLLPFVQKVAAPYLSHPSAEVRKAAAKTCCSLLISNEAPFNSVRIGSYSGLVVEEVLQNLLRVAVTDVAINVRLCVVNSLDSRYDLFLCQAHNLQQLFLLLQDEGLQAKAAGLRLLGRLTAMNPGPILPVLRRLLSDIILELKCGVDTGRGREDATRLLVVFLRCKSLQRLVHSVLPALLEALPLNNASSPRLASASLEALGELAQATGVALKPRVKELVTHVLDIMRDRSSASKQRTSLRTLGQIAGSTGYVIRPYLDFPMLLIQATEILPATKRAPWSLRREVIRTLGILGALDADRYRTVASKTRKSNSVVGANFEVDLADVNFEPQMTSWQGVPTPKQVIDASAFKSTVLSGAGVANEPRRGLLSTDMALDYVFVDDDDSPAYLSMFLQYAMVAQPVSSLPPTTRILPTDDDFYPTVAIQALMRIFRDPSLAVHHGMVIEAVMFIFKSLSLRCVPYLTKVVPRMIYTVRTCGPSNLRESLLKHLATLSCIVREHLRPFVADIFDVVELFWATKHISTIFTLICNLAVGVPDEFRRFVPRLIRRLLTTFDDLQIADWSSITEARQSALGKSQIESERLRLILKSVSSLNAVLGDYLNILVPALLKLSDTLASVSALDEYGLPDGTLLELSVLVYRTMSSLLDNWSPPPHRLSSTYYSEEKFLSNQSSENGLASRVVQPIIRIFREKSPKSSTVALAMIETLCVCMRHVGWSNWIQMYDGVVRNAISDWERTIASLNIQEVQITAAGIESHTYLYDLAVQDLILPPEQRDDVSPLVCINSFLNTQGFQLSTSVFTSFDNVADVYDPYLTSFNQSSVAFANKQKLNQATLQRAWDVSQRTSRDDWDEWMRRFAIQLLREAPSPALRATSTLAHAYQPLARELFSAAFACCWKDLTEPYRANLIHALRTVFIADVSPEILQGLLNLAEFMEHDPSGGLPIEIPILAELALKCRAYAKALHYKEREYANVGTSECVEALISINGKLDLPEAALGVLKASSIGDALIDGFSEHDEQHSTVSKHQASEMFYSVIWNTEGRELSTRAQVDHVANEELWLAKLGSWTEALAAHEEKLKLNPDDIDAIIGCMQCLVANGDWHKVLELANDKWAAIMGWKCDIDNTDSTHPKFQRKAVRMCAQAAWRLGQWGELEKFSSHLVAGSEALGSNISPSNVALRESAGSLIDFDGAFYSAVLHIHRKEWPDAAISIDAARRAMDGRLTALMAESYSSAYPSMVAAQTLSEMEEIIEFRKLEERSTALCKRHPANRPNEVDTKEQLLKVWRDRLAGCHVDSEVHSSILAVRSLVVGPAEEIDATLTLSELSRQAHRYRFAERVLLDPLESLGADIGGRIFGFGLSESLRLRVDFTLFSQPSYSFLIDRVLDGDLSSILPGRGSKHEQWSKALVSEAGGLERLVIQYRLYFAFVRHLWYTDRRDEAVDRLSYLSDVVDMVSDCENIKDSSLRASCWIELGEWKLAQSSVTSKSYVEEPLQLEVLTDFKRATLLPGCGYRAWHSWALLNFRIALQLSERDSEVSTQSNPKSPSVLRSHVIAAVTGFVNAISQGTKKWSASVQQDLLNLLTCLFKFGSYQDVAKVINGSIASIAIEAWLGVIPQLLARIQIRDTSIRSVLHPLLARLGEKHPQALMYPLSVLVKSPVVEQRVSAQSLMNSLKDHSSELVEEALMVSSELIRVAILWLETWHEALEDASRMACCENNVPGMLELLLPLHATLEKGASTKLENDFLQSFGQELEQAHKQLKEYIFHTNLSRNSGASGRHGEEAEKAISFAWDVYYTVFRQINKQLPSLTNLDLVQCSPSLSRARRLELGVPGSYRVDGTYVKIEKFISNVDVINSKQRPRKITLRGSDGQDYVFLLKGHEDLRQDDRVMQVFGLVNALLIRDPQTRKHDLKIQRYAISPLSHNCGVVGWVPHCDTLHSLIKDYRQAKKIPLNMENREMLKLAPDFDLLTVMQKVEVFVEALKKTTGNGNDLAEILWLKSANSEEWLERRTKYTRSLAVMSMVGYILGLGDRHPSNLMLDKISGRILHIDFGDCFEVAMNRDKYPEQIPFRLTRMLIKAMEVSGIEGSYRSTCERTMSVLRDNRDSLVAMLEAFVYDPLVSWRLADVAKVPPKSTTTTNTDGNIVAPVTAGTMAASVVRRGIPVESITEEDDFNEENYGTTDEVLTTDQLLAAVRKMPSVPNGPSQFMGFNTRDRAKSFQMFADIQAMAASVNADLRIASISGKRSDAKNSIVDESMTRSRVGRNSMRQQREFLSYADNENNNNNNSSFGATATTREEALNEKALKIIRRVQDKLSGTDFPDCVNGEPLIVPDQVQRLIVQATSSENLSQLYVGWCSFW